MNKYKFTFMQYGAHKMCVEIHDQDGNFVRLFSTVWRDTETWEEPQERLVKKLKKEGYISILSEQAINSLRNL